jgi:hypothetical protein
MTQSRFDWSAFEGPYESAAHVPERLAELRSLPNIDELRQELGEIAVFGLDNGYLTVAAAPLVEILLDEALVADTDSRPAWPYLVHVRLALSVRRLGLGLLPTSFFSPLVSEAERVHGHLVHRERQREVERAVLARAPVMIDAARMADGEDASHWISVLHLAGGLSVDDGAWIAAIFDRRTEAFAIVAKR